MSLQFCHSFCQSLGGISIVFSYNETHQFAEVYFLELVFVLFEGKLQKWLELYPIIVEYTERGIDFIEDWLVVDCLGELKERAEPEEYFDPFGGFVVHVVLNEVVHGVDGEGLPEFDLQIKFILIENLFE